VQPQTFPFQNIPYVTSSEKAGLSFQLICKRKVEYCSKYYYDFLDYFKS